MFHSCVDFVGCVTADCMDFFCDHHATEFSFFLHLRFISGTRTIRNNLLFASKWSCTGESQSQAKPKIQETRFYAFYLLCARTLVWFIFLAITVRDGRRRTNNNAYGNENNKKKSKKKNAKNDEVRASILMALTRPRVYAHSPADDSIQSCHVNFD